ncbi:hypothetical protein [uncultured Clostridium sp.]|uniref:hypothetical protein n=1 Tax=uncultured Clostridium sp. TaxID=59620 RepID=UPI0032167CCC
MRKNIVFINGKRDGYAPSQCSNTLTVGELIEILENYDSDAEVYLRNDNGYTYGSITDDDIYDNEESEEDEEK